ncbi:hypothetical protein MNBD_GAMMA13-1183, partial [hydrothermal vent metagenome]
MKRFILICALLTTSVVIADEQAKGKENHLRMDAQQRAAQGVVTARAEKRRLTDAVSAPGEVVV